MGWRCVYLLKSYGVETAKRSHSIEAVIGFVVEQETYMRPGVGANSHGHERIKSMQADTRSKQFSFPGVCPLCNTPLNITAPTSSAPGIVTCSSCGYSGPYVQRQRHHTPPVDLQAPSAQG